MSNNWFLVKKDVREITKCCQKHVN